MNAMPAAARRQWAARTFRQMRSAGIQRGKVGAAPGASNVNVDVQMQHAPPVALGDGRALLRVAALAPARTVLPRVPAGMSALNHTAGHRAAPK